MDLIKRVLLGIALWAPVTVVWAASPAKSAAKGPDFAREVRPILSDNCFACHGPDEKGLKAKLRLDRAESATHPAKSGAIAVVPGDTGKSELMKRVLNTDPDEIMPPPKTKKKLTAAQIDILRRWIASGARYDTHWAFEAPRRPATPQVKDKKWARNDIDAFVLARLEKEKLKPSEEADKETLIRRASLDLTGLPPTPAEVDAFVADKSVDAYEKVLARLFKSPRYGEHMARYWMDAARYADSHGFHIDSERSIWKWRDWVVSAFNQNMPFDQFTVEQLAGDLLPNPTVDQKIASGYVRCNMSTGEGGAIEEEYRVKYAFDRLETTGTIWMGLTFLCCRCHTHKYDPIQQREYYGLYSFFNNLNEPVMDGNKPNPDPFLRVPSVGQSQRMEELKGWIADGQKKIDEPMPELDQAQAKWIDHWHEKLSAGWTTLEAVNARSTLTNGASLASLEDGSVLASEANPESDVYELLIKPKPGLIAALRLETLPHDSLPKKSAGRADDGRFRLSEIEAELLPPPPVPDSNPTDGPADKPAKPENEEKEKSGPKEPEKGKEKVAKAPKPTTLKFSQAVADAAEANFEVAKAIDGKADTGWGVAADAVSKPHTVLFALNEAVKVPPDGQLRVRLRFEASKSKRAIGHFRLAAAQNDELVNLLNPPKFEAWKVVGPFKTQGLQHGYTNVFAPEETIDLKKTYAGVREEIKWNTKAEFADGKKNLLVQDLHGIHGAYYLYRTLSVPAPRQVELGLRADDAFKLWVNGKLVAQRAEDKPTDGMLRVKLELQKGENKFLFKVVTVQGAAYFTFDNRFGDADSVPADIAAILATTKELSTEQAVQTRNYYRREHSPEFKSNFEQVAKWREENEAVDKAIPTTLVAKEMDKARETFLLMRGEYDKKGDRIEPTVPSILSPFPAGAPTNRLGLAQWLIDPAHPLTARVMVNRLWQQFFGVGLVKTSDDFGIQGEPPTHPQLLDWLATEFVQCGWDVQRLQRLMLTSATYRQTSKTTPEMHARDPENRLLARGARFRMDGEVLRDTALFVGGLLVEKQGGRSVKPYEPPGLWEAVSFNNSQKYVQDKGEGNYRRSLYTHWKRQSPPPNMLLFDAPTREYCVVRRPRTNTPLQALALLNDPQFVEASRGLGFRMLRDGGDNVRKKIAYGFRVAIGREPSAEEVKVLARTFEEEFAEFRNEQASAAKFVSVGENKPTDVDAVELAAWTTVASTILNLDEAVTKN